MMQSLLILKISKHAWGRFFVDTVYMTTRCNEQVRHNNVSCLSSYGVFFKCRPDSWMLYDDCSTSDVDCSLPLLISLICRCCFLMRLQRLPCHPSLETSDAVLELAVLGGVDERVDAAVDEHQYHCEVVEPVTVYVNKTLFSKKRNGRQLIRKEKNRWSRKRRRQVNSWKRRLLASGKEKNTKTNKPMKW